MLLLDLYVYQALKTVTRIQTKGQDADTGRLLGDPGLTRQR